MCFLYWMGQNPNLTAFTSKIQVFCRPEWTKGGPHENEFWQFLKCENDVPKQLGLKKSRWKNWVISLVFISSSWFMVLKLSKIVFFLCSLLIYWCQQKIYISYSNLCICIWNYSFRSFKKWCWLLCHNLEFRRY